MSHPAESHTPQKWFSGQLATGSRFIPNVAVETHRGERKLFYDDLVRGKTVIVQFVSIAHHNRYPVTRNLQRVQRLLGGRAGRDVFLYSLTADPARDTPADMARFAARFSPGPGWLFLSGEVAAMEALKRVFFFHSGGHAGHHTQQVLHADPTEHRANTEQGLDIEHGLDAEHVAAAQVPDCSLGLMRYGNDVTGLWASVPTKADPAMIVERLTWLQPQSAARRGRPPKRRGPTPSTHRNTIL